MDVDLPSLHLDMIDEKSHQSLALREVELVDCGQDLAGEASDPLPEAVVGGERLSLGDELVSSCGQLAVAVIDVDGPLGELVRLQETGLIKISDAAAFSSGCLDAPVEAAELAGEQLVVGCRAARRHGLLAGQQDLGRGQRSPDLVEHEGVERFGPDVALLAMAFFAGDVGPVATGVVADARGFA